MQTFLRGGDAGEGRLSLQNTTNRLRNEENLGFLDHCRVILKRPHESRSPAENHTLLKLVERSEFLKEVNDMQGVEFLKGILRHAKLEMVDQQQVIVEEDQHLNYMLVVLQGNLAVEKPSFAVQFDPENAQGKKMSQNLSLKTDSLLDKLTDLARKKREEQKKASKVQRKTSLPISEYQFVPPVLSKKDFAAACSNIQKTILMNEQYGGKQRLNSSSYRSRVFALERSTLLIFEMNFLFYWLETTFKTKMTKKVERIKTIAPFQAIEEEKLREIITNMKLRKKKKNDLVYSQGQDAQLIYLLLQGQLKISKDVDLFKENPNDFYVDRRKLVKQIKSSARPAKSRSVHKKDDDVLQFANLTRLYNYRPIKKSIEISLISSFGLFGEEEVVYQTKRQATLHVNSIEASFYEIDFKKMLEIIGSKAVQKFKEGLQVSVSKKVLYRQLGVADQIDFQNRTNLNYFYLEEGKSQESPRKLKLEKINQNMVPRTACDTTDHAPAFYTSFNFNKMLDKGRQNNSSKKKTHESLDVFQSTRYNPTEERLMGISHSWNPIEKKVKQQKLVSFRISPVKQQINISEPLIDQQFFKDMAKQQRRINKEFRTVRLSLGKRMK